LYINKKIKKNVKPGTVMIGALSKNSENNFAFIVADETIILRAFLWRHKSL
jgi:hypothetical protein